LQLDLVAFTELSQSISALEVARMLHQFFSAFDTEVQRLNLFKMDTIGDSYIVAGWLPAQDARGSVSRVAAVCHRALYLAGVMHEIVGMYETPQCGHRSRRVSARIGIGIGEVVLGALGSLQTRMHLCGQGLREAEALEERAAPGTVCVSHRFLSALSGQDSPGALLSEAGGDGAEAPLGWDMLQVIDETAGEGSGSDAASGRARAHRGAPRAYLLQKGQA